MKGLSEYINCYYKDKTQNSGRKKITAHLDFVLPYFRILLISPKL